MRPHVAGDRPAQVPRHINEGGPLANRNRSYAVRSLIACQAREAVKGRANETAESTRSISRR
jgi:hypothetical protein